MYKRKQWKIPVIAGTGSNSTEEAISLTTHAEKAGQRCFNRYTILQ